MAIESHEKPESDVSSLESDVSSFERKRAENSMAARVEDQELLYSHRASSPRAIVYLFFSEEGSCSLSPASRNVFSKNRCLLYCPAPLQIKQEKLKLNRFVCCSLSLLRQIKTFPNTNV